MNLCPNCGAPLDLDPEGRCRWCHVRVSVPASQPFASATSESGLVPDDLGYEAVAPFIHLALSTLALLEREAAVQQYARAEPAACRAIRELSAAVAGAGVRVRDSGQMRDSFDERLRLFTAGEIWASELYFDVIAMLGGLAGISPGTHARVVDDLKSLDEEAHGLHWKAEVRRAGDGPAEFRELRTHVPHRTLYPRSWVRYS